MKALGCWWMCAAVHIHGPLLVEELAPDDYRVVVAELDLQGVKVGVDDISWRRPSDTLQQGIVLDVEHGFGGSALLGQHQIAAHELVQPTRIVIPQALAIDHPRAFDRVRPPDAGRCSVSGPASVSHIR